MTKKNTNANDGAAPRIVKSEFKAAYAKVFPGVTPPPFPSPLWRYIYRMIETATRFSLKSFPMSSVVDILLASENIDMDELIRRFGFMGDTNHDLGGFKIGENEVVPLRKEKDRYICDTLEMEPFKLNGWTIKYNYLKELVLLKRYQKQGLGIVFPELENKSAKDLIVDIRQIKFFEKLGELGLSINSVLEPLEMASFAPSFKEYNDFLLSYQNVEFSGVKADREYMKKNDILASLTIDGVTGDIVDSERLEAFFKRYSFDFSSRLRN